MRNIEQSFGFRATLLIEELIANKQIFTDDKIIIKLGEVGNRAAIRSARVNIEKLCNFSYLSDLGYQKTLKNVELSNTDGGIESAPIYFYHPKGVEPSPLDMFLAREECNKICGYMISYFDSERDSIPPDSFWNRVCRFLS